MFVFLVMDFLCDLNRLWIDLCEPIYGKLGKIGFYGFYQAISSLTTVKHAQHQYYEDEVPSSSATMHNGTTVNGRHVFVTEGDGGVVSGTLKSPKYYHSSTFRSARRLHPLR